MNAVQDINSDSNMMLDHQIIVCSNCIGADIYWYTWYTRSSNMIFDHANQVVPLQRVPIGPLGALGVHKNPSIFDQ